MAPHCAALYGLFLVLALASISLSSSCQLVKGSVSCLDCSPHKDLSGMRVGVKCKNDKELVYALTNREGYFEAVIHANSSSSSSPNCVVMLLGGPVQVWAFKKSMMSKIVKGATGQKGCYSLSTRLTFFTSYPSKAHQSPDGSEKAPQSGVSAAPNGSSSTGGVGLPRPGNWTSTLPLIFYFPFLPIIGIP